jgi:hypothetical protein
MTHEQIECSFTPVPDFVAGKEAALRIRAQSSQSHKPVAGASVQVRILSTSGKGEMVFQGMTGADGACPVTFPVPQVGNGSAAAVIRVKSPIGATEFKFPVRTTDSARGVSIRVNGDGFPSPAFRLPAPRALDLVPRVAVERNREILPKASTLNASEGRDTFGSSEFVEAATVMFR